MSNRLSHLFKNDSLGVRSSSEGVGLPAGSEVSLFVVEIGPSLDPTVLHVLPGGPDTCGLTHDGVFLARKFHPLPNDSKKVRKRKFQMKTSSKTSIGRLFGPRCESIGF